MNLSEIKESIKKWNAIAKDKEALKPLFLNQSHFKFDADLTVFPQVVGEFIHVYPGIHNQKLVYFLVSSVYDKGPFFAANNIEDFIVQCDMVQVYTDSKVQFSEIPNQEAYQRIENWANNYEIWIDEIVETEMGIYRAFCIPNGDLNAGTDYCYRPFLALNILPEIMAADLVIENLASKTINDRFTDTVYPVPPFGGNEANFHLLNIALI